MNMRTLGGLLLAAAFAVSIGILGGCRTDPAKTGDKTGAKTGDKTGGGGDNKGAGGKAPAFKLAWSEYPSWSVFGVASELGLINGDEGKQGSLEKKWGVDVVLELLEYDPCLQLYGAKKCDAVCATNIDIMSYSLERKAVAVLPTSTSVGADACLVTFDVSDKKKAVEELKKHKVFGLASSVSEYAFNRNLELLGLKPADYKFTDEPPNTAAGAMAAKQKDHQAIMVWNPFVLEVLNKNKDAKRIFDSSTIPEEIIDMVIVADESLKKEKGDAFAHCVIDTYYEMNKLLQSSDQKEADKVLIKIGEKFSKLGLEDMRTCVKETRFYKNPDEAIKLFKGDKLPATMKIVSKFCTDKKMTKSEVKYAFGEAKTGEDLHLRFDSSYITKVQATK